MADQGLKLTRLWYVYIVLTFAFVVAWNVFFGVGRLARTTEEHVYRIAFIALHVSIGAGLLWWEIRSQLDELDDLKSDSTD
jgi:hypothetical protein